MHLEFWSCSFSRQISEKRVPLVAPHRREQLRFLDSFAYRAPASVTVSTMVVVSPSSADRT